MSHFQFEAAVDDCLGTFNGPIANGPTPRWQRKAFEWKTNSSSVPLSPSNTNRPSRTPIRTPRRGRTPLKTPKKTPQKTPAKTTPLVDRFIPNRATMDIEKNYFQLVNELDSDVKEGQISPESLEKFQYQKTMKDHLEITGDSRILHFKQRAPTAREGTQFFKYNKNNVKMGECLIVSGENGNKT